MSGPQLDTPRVDDVRLEVSVRIVANEAGEAVTALADRSAVLSVERRQAEPAYEFVTLRLPLLLAPRLGMSVMVKWSDPVPVAVNPEREQHKSGNPSLLNQSRDGD